MSDGRTTKLSTELDATGVEQGAEKAKRALTGLANTAQTEGQRAAKGIEGIGAGGEAAAGKLDRTTKSIVSSIQRTTAVMEAGERGSAKYFEALANQRGANLDALKPYLDQLRQAEAAQRAASGSLDKIGVSAKQTAFALRGVPAQFTDIITSLQGGQAPITVLLQQGGQLKDMFGGVGNAAKALGGYVAGLISPLTLAAAAVGILAFGYAKGSQEATEFNRTLILTGNAAGVTAAGLSDAAAAVSKLTGATQGRAAEVLNSLAASGISGAVGLERFAAAALTLERVGGPAAEQTAKAFADLGAAPLQASLKLNESTNFLTRSVYEQIKALTDQGRAVEAARTAQDAYAQAVEQRAPAIAAQLGIIESAWKGIKDNTLGAIDATLKAGRDSPLAQQVLDLKASIAYAEQLGRLDSAFGQYQRERGEALKKELATLQARTAAEETSAKAQADAARAAKAGIEFDQQGEQFVARRVVMERQIEAARNSGIAAGLEREEIEQRIADIRQKFDPGVDLQKVKDAEAKRLELIKRAQNEVDALRATGQLNEQGAIEQTTALTLRAIDARSAGARAELDLAKKRKDSEKEVAALEGELALLSAERVTAQIKGSSDLATAIYKQKQAIDAVIRAQQQETEDDRSSYFVNESKAREALSLSVFEYSKAIKEEADQTAYESTLLGLSSQARNVLIAQYRIQIELKRQLAEVDKLYGTDPQGDIERDRLRLAASQASAAAAGRIVLDEWQKTADTISSTLTDAILEGGQNGADALKKLFKDLVLRPTIQAGLQQGVGALLQLLSGGSAQGSSAGGANGLQSTASLANTLYGLGNSTGLYGSAASYFAGSGSLTGAGSYQAYAAMDAAYGGASTGAVSANAAGGAGSSAGASSAAGAYAAIIYALSTAAASDFRKGFNAESARNTGTLLGYLSFGINNALTKIGISNEAASIISGSTGIAKLFGYGTTRVEGRNIVGSIDSSGFTGTLDTRTKTPGGLFRSDRVDTYSDALSSDIDRALDESSAKIRDQAKKYGAALGLPIDQIDSAVKSFNVDITFDTQEQAIQHIQDALSQYSNDLVEGFAPAVESVKNLGETTAQTIERVSGAILSANQVLGQLGIKALDASVTGGKAAVSLEDMFGGLQNLQDASTTYYQQFFSDEERRTKGLQQVTDALSSVGVALPASREAFRGVVEGLDLTTEAGRQQFATMISLSGAFADLVPATAALADTSTKAAEEMAAAASKALASLGDDRAKLEADLLRAQGDATGALAAQRQIALNSLTASVAPDQAAAIAAAYDYNQSLREQAAALDAATQAAAAAATAEQQRQAAIASERTSLETQLLQAQGDTVALRQQELAALDPSNRALQQRIFDLQDEAAAAAQAAQEQAAAQQAAAAAANERVNLEGQILQLQGDTTALRQRELASLDPSNRALQERIYSLQDEATAAQQAAQAEAAAAQQAAAVANERANLEVQLLQAQGDTAALRARELAALDESNRSIQERIYAIQDEAAAQQAAAQAEAEAAQQAAAIASERTSLETQLLQAQGDTVALRQRERAALDVSNQALYDQIQALNDQQAAAQAAAQAEATLAAEQQRIATERAGLESTLLQLQGDTAALRARELAGLDGSNRGLQEQIYALQDQQTAAQEAAQALAALNSSLDNLGNTRFGLENQLLGLQGNNAEVARRTRERDIAQLTAGLSAEDAARVTAAYDLNTALQQQITDTQAAQQAAQELAAAQAQAAAESARAADAIKQAWQSATDAIFQEVARIRGVDGTSPQSLAKAQADFAIATAKARAGDQDAAKQLPSLSQALLQLAQAQAVSSFDLARLRGQIAASLQGTGNNLAGLFGLTVPKLATGTNYVSQDMLALVHEGEAVVPRVYNPAAGGGATQQNDALLNAVETLRSDQRGQADTMNRLLARMEKTFGKWDSDGLPQARPET